MIPMTTSDRAFEQAANAFAATTQAQYVRYEEKIPIDSKTLRINQAFSESVVRRNSDDTSVVTFESGRFYRARRHLITPSFNVMSDFGLRGTFSSSGQFSMWVENVVPLKYNLTPRPGVGVVSVALQKYRTQFVDDVGPDQLHIHLDSANGETSILPRLFFKDVYIDAKFGLPLRTELVGPDERDFDVRYEVASGKPVIRSFLFDQTFSTGLVLVRARATIQVESTHVLELSDQDDAIFNPTAATPNPTSSEANSSDVFSSPLID